MKLKPCHHCGGKAFIDSIPDPIHNGTILIVSCKQCKDKIWYCFETADKTAKKYITKKWNETQVKADPLTN